MATSIRKLGISTALIISAIIIAAVGVGIVKTAFANHSAATNDNICGNHDNVRYKNCAEKEAYDNCGTEHQGAIWMTQQQGFTHNQNIEIGTTGNQATLYLQGSVYTCKTAKSGNKAVYACNISFKGTDKDKFSLVPGQGNDLYRGTSTTDKYTFFEPDSSDPGLPVNVNVSSIAPGETDTFSVGINRIYGWGGCKSSQTSGGYDTTTIGVKITRKNDWQITPSINTNVTTIHPGQTITWWHTIAASTGDPSSVNYGYESTNAGVSNPSAWTNINLGVGGSKVMTSTYQVPIGTPNGTLICRNTVVGQGSYNTGVARSGTACVTVVVVSPPSGDCDSNMPTSFVIGGTAATLTPSIVIKSGLIAQPSGASMVSAWSQSNPPAPLVATPSHSSYDAATKQLTITANGISYQPSTKGTYRLRWQVNIPASAATGDVPISITCDDQGDAGDLPYFEISGGDVIAGVGSVGESGVATWNTGSSGGYAGGNNNLAVIATGRIDGVITGKGNPVLPALSFASDTKGTATDFGGGLDASSMPSSVSYSDKIDTSSATTIGGNSLVIGLATKGVFVADQDVTVHGTVGASKTVTLIVRGGHNVFIDGTGVNYGAYSTLSAIPRFTVYVVEDSGTRGNIVISGSVTSLHGNYITDGTFYTCGGSPTGGYDYTNLIANPSHITDCTNQLTIYGTVAAQKLMLTRTSGSYVKPNTAAETFKYGPEVWLGAPESTRQYDYYVSLPPIL